MKEVGKTFNRWDIAYRTGKDSPFVIVPQPDYGWIADPFLVRYRGEIYLFAEIFLYLSERNGVIGYCKYDGEKFGQWEVTMDCHWHLSYPFVYEKDDQLYMIPESYQLGEVNLYRLKAFPNKWEKMSTFIMNVEYCDATIFSYKDTREYMFVYERENTINGAREYVYEVTSNGLKNKQLVSDNLEGMRCGGKIIVNNGQYVRVAQDSAKEYGRGIIFYEIDQVYPKYSEHELRRVYPESINVKSSKIYTGLHTYNCLDGIEVIDLKYQVNDIKEEKASERVRKVFTNKYFVSKG